MTTWKTAVILLFTLVSSQFVDFDDDDIVVEQVLPDKKLLKNSDHI